MIDAMPSILKRRPDAVYVVLGATHPNLVRIRVKPIARLIARARTRHRGSRRILTSSSIGPRCSNSFQCGRFVAPYLNEAQMTSGTLAYSFGLSKPVVSTPYWHARPGRWARHSVPFDAAGIGNELAQLLTDEPRRQACASGPTPPAGR
jgi:hypothetical protein